MTLRMKLNLENLVSLSLKEIFYSTALRIQVILIQSTLIKYILKRGRLIILHW